MSDARAADPALWERYTRERGRVHLTGLQALVRMVLEQLRRDARAERAAPPPRRGGRGSARAHFPLAAPADPADVVRLGLAAFELSRYAGLWTGMRVVADVADAGRIFDLDGLGVEFERPEFAV